MYVSRCFENETVVPTSRERDPRSEAWNCVRAESHDVMMMMMEMEMDSHGGLKVTIRQTESKKNYPTTSWNRPLSARNEHQSHPLAGQAQACGRLIRRMDRGPDGTC